MMSLHTLGHRHPRRYLTPSPLSASHAQANTFDERAASPRSAPSGSAAGPAGRRSSGSLSRHNSAPAAAPAAPAASSRRRAQPARTSQRTVAKVSYAESDDSDSEGGGGRGRRGGGGSNGRVKELLSAFDDPDEEEDVDMEVDKVLSHRCGVGGVWGGAGVGGRAGKVIADVGSSAAATAWTGKQGVVAVTRAGA